MTEGLRPGSVFAGHRIDAVVGIGGMGVVYRAVHLELERTVALKVIAPERAADPAFRARFRRESRLAAALEHPAILTVYDSGERDGLLYVTMRLVDGPDLGRRLATAGPMDPHDAIATLLPIASALDAAHGRGLVHRDVKPANVLLEPPRVFLCDFGLAKPLDATGGPTLTGDWLGTVDYAAPEQISEARAEPGSDIYALAGVLFTALTCRVPYPRDDLRAVMWAHVHDPPPGLDGLEHPARAALEGVIARGMAKDPADRYASAGELAAAAQAALGDERTLTAPPLRAAAPTPTTAPAPPDPQAWGGMAGEPAPHAGRPAAGAPAPQAGRAAAGAPAPQAGGAAAATSRPRSAAWRAPRVLLLAVPLAVAVVVAVLLLARGGGEEALGARIVIDPIRLAGEPVGVVERDGRAWVAVERDDAGALIPVEGTKPGQAIALTGAPRAVAAGAGALWVLVGGTPGGLQRVNPDTRTREGGPVPVSVNGDAQVAVGAGGVWITDPIGDAVIRVNPETAQADPPIKVPAGVDGPLAVGEGGVWVLAADVSADRVSVTRIDPDTRRPDPPTRIGAYAQAHAIAAGAGGVWVGDGAGDAVRRIDPQTRRVDRKAVPLTDGPQQLAIGGGAVWALDSGGDTVTRIDPGIPAARGAPTPVAAGSGARLTVGDGAAWVTSTEGTPLQRLGY